MRLAVHDLVTLNHGETVEEGYERTKRFVKEIEQLNFHRYWFAEHHNSNDNASSSPELMVAYMSAITNKLRLGTGGTMIMHYSPLKIAENFKTLTTLAPGRVDLGLGRAPGSGHHEIIALAQGKPDAFSDMYDKIEVILDYLKDERAAGFYGNTQAVPFGTQTLPEPWMLGSSGQSATKAAEMGLGYSFAKFFGLKTEPEVFQAYRQQFTASKFFEKPQVMVSYMIIVADTEEEANYYAKPLELSRVALNKGQMIANMDPEEVKDFTFSASDEAYLQGYYQNRFIIKGTPAQVEAILEDEINTLGIDEVMVYAPIFDEKARVNSYRYLAKMFGKI